MWPPFGARCYSQRSNLPSQIHADCIIYVRLVGKPSTMVARTKLQDAVGFVLYELWMLRECAHMATPPERVPRNLWYEGLVLDSRVLRDFFFTKVDQNTGARATHRDDIVAVDYVGTPDAWPYTSQHLSPYLKRNKERMDVTLAHLSIGRLKYQTRGKDWSASQLLSEIAAKWFEFIANLEQDDQQVVSWFRKHRRARLVRFSPPL